MGSDVHALAAVSVVAGALGVIAIAALFHAWGGLQAVPGSSAWSIAATAVAVTCPLYWFMAARPLSDVMGLTAAIAVQAMMLWTRPNLRTLIDALYYTLVAPWVLWWIAAVVLVFALAGAVALLRRQRDALVALAVAFGPYFLFDLLFQETFTGRYALPVVIP